LGWVVEARSRAVLAGAEGLGRKRRTTATPTRREIRNTASGSSHGREKTLLGRRCLEVGLVGVSGARAASSVKGAAAGTLGGLIRLIIPRQRGQVPLVALLEAEISVLQWGQRTVVLGGARSSRGMPVT